MRLINFAGALGAVVLAFAVILPVAGNSAEARNAPLVTETVEVKYTTVEGVFVTTVRVSASRQRGPYSDGEVVVRYSVTTCTSIPLLLHVCYSDLHGNGFDTNFEFNLREANIIVFEQENRDCGLFCPLGLDRPIIELDWEGTGGVEITKEEGTKTKTRTAKVTGRVDEVTVPNDVYGTISVVETRN